MDDLEKEVLAASAKAVLAPFTKPVTDLIGLAGGDYLEDLRAAKRERRKANQTRTLERAAEIVRERGITPDPETPPEHIEDIVEAAQDNNVEELRELFARLAAAAVDPARRGGYRREFVAIVKEFEPIDALVLPVMVRDNIGGTRWAEVTAERINRDKVEVELSGVNLARLGCLFTGSERIEMNAFLTSLGRQLAKVIAD